MSEIEAFPRAVLSHHYQDTPLHGDFTTIEEGDYDPIDVLVGGTPCQSFSVAGLRGGLADERGNLALEYLRLAERLRPGWLVWENVPGVLSSGGGRDFGSFVGGLAELGYGWAYRVLDAQFFGLAQRRKRVFVVGCLGDWRRAAAVLFEPASLRWHPPPSREARQGIAPTIGARTTAGGGLGTDFDLDGGLIANTLRSGSINPASHGKQNGTDRATLIADTVRSHPRPGSNSIGNIAMSLNAHGGSGRMDGESETFVAHSLRADGFDASEDGTGRGTPLVFNHKANAHQSMNPGPISPGLDIGKAGGLCVAFQTSQSGVRDHETHATLDANNGSRRHNGAIVGSTVRRLTPKECERLMGFPDDYTLIQYRWKPAADGPRYRALGNSMAVPVMAWIGRRINRLETNQPKPKVEVETLGLFSSL